MYKIVAIKRGYLTIVLVENQPSDQKRDWLTVCKVVGDSFEVVKRVSVPKIYSACLAARDHHSVKEEDATKHAQENTFYTSYSTGGFADDLESGSPGDAMF